MIAAKELFEPIYSMHDKAKVTVGKAELVWD
jgi:hypothetical protein